MKNYEYIIEGTLYNKNEDVKNELYKLASELGISIDVSKTKDGLIIIAPSNQKNLVEFEPLLFKKLFTFYDISKYAKKDLETNKKMSDEKEKNQNKSEYTQKDIKLITKLLRQAKLIAVKQDNGFHIICNASQVQAIQTLRDLTNQPDIPLPVIFRSIQKARQQVILSKKEEELLLKPKHPGIVAKIKNLHRLERPKYSLSPTINELNQRVHISLKQGKFYTALFEIVDFPIVSIDALDKNADIIVKRDKLLEIYGNKLAYILDMDKKITAPSKRETIQFVHGKQQYIQAGCPKMPPGMVEPPIKVCLNHERSIISKDKKTLFEFKTYKILLNEKKLYEPQLSALSIMFEEIPLDQITRLNLPFEINEIYKLYEDWQNNVNTQDTNSLFPLFDAIASLSGELHQKSFDKQSILLAESHFDVCKEELFDFDIAGNVIDIDPSFLKNKTLKYLSCALTYTISSIITQITKEQNMPVGLCGDLFHYRDLTELIVEQLEDEDLTVYY